MRSRVLDAYGRHRLLSFDRDATTAAATVEVAHEALLWEWERLAEWIDRHRTALRRHETFVAALEEWEESGRDDGYLLTGSRLDEFAAWGSAGALRLTAREEEFLAASVDRRATEAEAAAASAAEVRRLERRSRNRLLALVGAVVVLAGGGAAAFAFLGDTPSTVALLHHSAGTVDNIVEAGFDQGVSDFGLVPVERDTDWPARTRPSRRSPTKARTLSSSLPWTRTSLPRRGATRRSDTSRAPTKAADPTS